MDIGAKLKAGLLRKLKEHAEKSFGQKLWTGVKIVVLSISLAIYMFFFFRLCTMGDPDSMSHVLWNDVNKAAYRADPAAFEILEQEPVSYITDDGRFWISNVIYLPAAKQLQYTIKYNNSTVKYLKADLEAAATKEGLSGEITIPDEPFDYSLLDENGNRYSPSEVLADRKQNYNYRRLVFDGIEMTEESIFYADMYYAGAVNYTGAPYGSLLVWHHRMHADQRELADELIDELKK
ncbi:MAG: hypothetical protein MJ175_12350 [Clostridia bacterium]|nr:hypothetical protein [Clostridia bacterium]